MEDWMDHFWFMFIYVLLGPHVECVFWRLNSYYLMLLQWKYMKSCFTSIWLLVRNISSCFAYFENPSNVGRKVQTYTLCRLFVNTSLGCNWWIYSNSLRFEKILGYLHNWKKKTYACSTSTCVLSVTSKPVICCHICRSLTERFLSAKDCTEAASSNFNPDSCLSLCCLLQLPTFYPPHITWDNMLLVTKYSCNDDQL